MKKYLNEKLVDMTAEEIARREAEVSAEQAAKPMNDWLAKMRQFDAVMPRALEDIIDALDETVRNNIAEETLAKYNAKKTERAKKPNAP